MAFPTSPTNGQIYNNREWSSSLGCWIKAKNRTVKTAVVPNSPGTYGQDQSSYNTLVGAPYKPTNIRFDNQSCFNSSNGVYTAKEAGTYLVSWSGLINTPYSYSYTYFYWVKNGISIKHGAHQQYDSRCHSKHNINRAYEPICASLMVELVEGDTISLNVRNEASAQIYTTYYTGLTILKVR